MIGDVIERSLRQGSPVIPVETLFANCDGSRMPEIIADRLTPDIALKLSEVCPTSALGVVERDGRRCLRFSYGQCIGCGKCREAGQGAVAIVRRFDRCGVAKEQTVRLWDIDSGTEVTPVASNPEATRGRIHSLLQRALNVRQLDAGSCNGCEAEITALTNPYYDLERFGIHFVASPKHADMLLVTGPVTRNMAEAVKATYEAVPAPKLVVAVGACGCSGGIFAGSHAIVGAVDAVIPVDGFIPGCPPTPAMLITGILEVLRRRVAK
ncbi:MAG TPA: NADH-quinone oxidoreductase subunit B family protein [Candidatus Acidoferrales bacterium]|nr:NADH-quinone oxidoreductase subunit B family protein [Candidatus Acidoferrales bacterium]